MVYPKCIKFINQGTTEFTSGSSDVRILLNPIPLFGKGFLNS